MAEELERRLEGGVLTLTLSRPDARNALNLVLIKALAAALREAEADPAVRCVVITGRGKAVATKERLQQGLNRIARSVWEMEKPVVAKVNGDTAGAGFGLMLACDLVYAGKLAASPTKTIGLAKRAMHRALASTFDEALEHEAYAQGYCFTTEDHAEGTRAYFEKRDPKFKGA